MVRMYEMPSVPFLPFLLTDFDGQERVLKDAEMMVPRTKTKLDRAVEELDDLVVSRFIIYGHKG